MALMPRKVKYRKSHRGSSRWNSRAWHPGVLRRFWLAVHRARLGDQ